MRGRELFWGAVLLTVGLLSCGGAKRIYLHTGDREPITVTPKSTAQVRLSEGEYKQALGWLGHDVYAGSSSLQAAHNVFDVPSIEVTIQEVEQTYQVELIAAYRRWCERKGTPGDCLKLLGRGTWLTGEAKQTLAMAFAMDSVWPETADALRGIADPMAIKAMILTSMTVYLGLLVLPEPTSKIIAAHLTAALIAYLGVDTVWELIQGWRELHKVARNAYSFDEIRGVGRRFGGIVCRNAARVFVMLTTAAIGSTIGLAGKLPSLPGSGQAAMVVANQAGFELSAIGNVTSVAVALDGDISLALPAGAVAMAGNTQGHHAYFKYLGGHEKQKLSQLLESVHQQLHREIYEFENGWLAPKQGMTGEMIVKRYGRQTVIEGLRRFYAQPQWKHLSADFEEALKFTLENE